MSAGASSKVVFHNESDDNHSVRIERIENVKDVRNYIDRIDEMIERKREFLGEISSRRKYTHQCPMYEYT